MKMKVKTTAHFYLYLKLIIKLIIKFVPIARPTGYMINGKVIGFKLNHNGTI